MHRLTKRDESLLRVVLGSLLDGVAAVDAKGTLLFINDAMARLLGFRVSAELPDLCLLDALARIEAFDENGRKLALDERPLMRALRGEPVVDAALRMRQPAQGREYDVLNSAFPIFEDDGTVAMAVIRMRDVTEQRRAMQALRVSEERYQYATLAIEAMIYDWSLVTGQILRTDAIEKIIGWSPREMEATRAWWLSLVHPEDIEELVSSRREAFEARAERSEAEYRIRHRDGHWVHVSDRFLALYDPEGKPLRVVGSVVDVTREKAAIQALADSEQRYRSLFENASDIVALLDTEMRIVSINPAVEAILGFSPASLEGRPFSDIVARETSLQPGTFEVEARPRDPARSVTLEVRANTLLDGRGRHIGLHLIARDVTERKLAEARQMLLVRELQHRTKNLLAVVQSLATNTLRNSTSLAQAHDALIGRLHAVATAQEFVTAGGGGAPLRALIEGEIAPFPGRTNISGPDLIVSNAFAQTFALVVHELVTNAAKYGALTSPKGKVELTWSVGQSESGEQAFRFAWTERDGPVVAIPRSAGFGRKIIGLLGQPTLNFAPEGLHYQVEVPMTELTP
ncbi:MAG: PAS domain S-box protein [Hyphomicrobiales bacterium]|nr:MAG: PAS domain S-box protein [Hyphomicrobiales bacterium]